MGNPESACKDNEIFARVPNKFSFFCFYLDANLVDVDHRNTRSAKLHMLVFAGLYVGYGAQILAYQLAQNTAAGAVENTYPRHADEDGIY